MLTAQPYRLYRQKLTLMLAIILTGCQSPFLVFPGGELKGKVSMSESFEFASDYNLLTLEVRPEAPYSVILRCVVIEGELYLDVAPARQWGKLIQEDPRVRVKLGEQIFPATAITVTDRSITEKFLQGRLVYRLMPGWSVKKPASQQPPGQRSEGQNPQPSNQLF